MTDPGLTFVTSSIINPQKTSEELFNRFYDEEHLPDILKYPHPKAPKLAKRYKNINRGSKNPYLALYPVIDAGVYQTAATNNLAKDVSISKTFDNQPISDFINATVYRNAKIHTYEGLHSNSEPASHAAILVAATMEPVPGTDQDCTDWYITQHLPMMSMLPSYRRSTRYQRIDGKEPRYLALHEFATLEGFRADEALVPRLMETEWSKKVMSSAKEFEMDIAAAMKSAAEHEHLLLVSGALRISLLVLCLPLSTIDTEAQLFSGPAYRQQVYNSSALPKAVRE
ncbi:hypothetical protein LTR86_009715 [Recurvomyces mirabilis]|nr:hypothetical protein LTR86_009715 [Recurvomyces mirabilis]